MRVLVCGGRNFRNGELVRSTLSELHVARKFSMVITGGATGADSLADDWAQYFGIDRIVFPANWKGRGKSAGPYRNGLMMEIARPHLVVAFPGGNGTASMSQIALNYGIELLTIHEGESIHAMR